MGSGSGLHALASALGAASPVLRTSAVTALGSVGTEATAPVIVAALRDGNPAVRAAAHSAVLRLATRLWESDRSTAHLLLERAIGAADSRVARVSALVAAIRLGADDASPALTLGRARDVEAVEEAERIAQTP
ncbi:MAG: HEAT repeat domain-containing protein [Armatimonadetes bacterium]|nr:HEAT repeat domain-containing protein [Armatimonadota bacterium]